jgi:serine/threonine-protein kinase
MSSEDQIDKVCDTFEHEWLNGEVPRIESFIGRVGPNDQASLFYELLLVDFEYRNRQGQPASREEYLQRFPQFSDQVEAAHFRFGGAAFATSDTAKKDSVGVRGRVPGSRIGHFELRERVGAGAMGEVWKAWDPQLQRQVAVKLPRVEQLSEADMHRFMREGRAAAQLRHPHLAQIYAVGRDGATAYIVAEFVEGENLRQFIENSWPNTNSSVDSVMRRSTFAALADLCAEIAEALHHAHEQGIVHRDLKPANIIVDRAGRPHVIDFGLAKWTSDVHELTLQGELLGTPAYMSPEQAGGNAARLDRRTDVYSLGVILYELLAGQCPFTGEMGSVIHRIIAIEAQPVRKLNVKVPRDLETICIKALEKSPNRRYATMQEMAVDLRRFARGEPILSRRPGPVERSWRWVRRHPGLAAAMLVIVLIVSTSGFVIRSLSDRNHLLQGYRQVSVQTSPDGARVAFVPIDKRTGEPDPNPAGIVRCTTPKTIWIKPGDYFEECVLTRDDGVVDLSEEYTTIPKVGMLSEAERSLLRQNGQDEDLHLHSIWIWPRENVVNNMVAVPIPESLRRGNPLLPSLLYVDRELTLPNSYPEEGATGETPSSFKRDGNKFIPLEQAIAILHTSGSRLPSALESEIIEKAIVECTELHDGSGRAVHLNPGPSPSAAWTSTKYEFPGFASPKDLSRLRSQHVLMITGDPDAITGATRAADGKSIAPPDTQSKCIGFRSVRSGTPRFVKP